MEVDVQVLKGGGREEEEDSIISQICVTHVDHIITRTQWEERKISLISALAKNPFSLFLKNTENIFFSTLCLYVI